MTTLARVYLVRHGETNANRSGVIQGQMDTPLNAFGVEQAKAVAEALRSVPLDQAYSSDLVRASKTAEMILKYHPNIQLQKKKELRERYLGELQGKPVREKTRLLATVGSTIEAEGLFIARAVSWWKGMILECTASVTAKNDVCNILVVSHGVFLKTMVTNLLESGGIECTQGVVIRDGKCANGSVTIIEIDKSGIGGSVVRYDDTSHIRKRDMVTVTVDTNVDEIEYYL